MTPYLVLDFSTFPPSLNNAFVTVGKRRVLSKRYLAWREASVWEIKAQAKGRRIEGPFTAELKFVRPDKRKRDIDNLIKPVLDLITACNIVDDDSEMQEVTAAWASEGPACHVVLISCNRRG